METVRDINNTVYSYGDYVVYAITYQRTSRLRFGRVTNVTGGRDRRVTVQGVSRDMDYNGDYKWVSLTPNSTAWGDLKMMIVDRTTLPTEAAELLDKAWKE